MSDEKSAAKERFSEILRRSNRFAESEATKVAALTAVVPGQAAPAGAGAGVEGGGKVKKAYYAEIPIDSVVPNPDQHRRTFHRESLELLGLNIQRIGLKNPITVFPVEFDSINRPTRYQIRAGERRWRAMRLVGSFKTIPAMVEPRGEEWDDAEGMYSENAFRTDLNAIDDARAIDDLISKRVARTVHQTGKEPSRRDVLAEAARERGLSVTEVYRRLALLDAPAPLQEALSSEDPERCPSKAQATALIAYADALTKRALRDPVVAKGKRLQDAVRDWLDAGGQLPAEPGEAEQDQGDQGDQGEQGSEAEERRDQVRVDADVKRALPNYCKVTHRKLAESRAALRKFGAAMARVDASVRAMVASACDPKRRTTASQIMGATRKVLGKRNEGEGGADAMAESSAATASESEFAATPVDAPEVGDLWSRAGNRITFNLDPVAVESAGEGGLQAARAAAQEVVDALEAAMAMAEKLA